MVFIIQEAMRLAATDLRKAGWPVEMRVDRVGERDTYAVSLVVEVPHMPVPIEAVGK